VSYVANSLGPDERVVYEASMHWIIYGWALLLATIGIVATLVLPPVGLAILAAGIVWMLFIRVARGSTELAVTNHKVVAKWGFITRQTIEQRLEKIDAIEVMQGFFGRVLDFGDLMIHGTGIDTVPIRTVAAPLTFRRKVEQAIEAKLRDLRPADPAPAGDQRKD
jgi:uncharacterized membrane protein YdbT with pleckstrin-like domain